MATCSAKSVLRSRLWLDPCNTSSEKGRYGTMLNYALLFLVVGLIAGALGMFGVAGVATQIAWILFLIGVVLLLVHLVSGRRTLTP
jgi:uncharacterized membrane protein YtjA (UPF0391 family)